MKKIKYEFLEIWAKKNGIKPMDAKNMARRGKLKGVTRCKIIKTRRWTIQEDFIPNK